MSNLHLATFRVDITPPLGYPLCGGWITPVQGVTDPLLALGVVLLGEDEPIVLCALDWCEIRNRDEAIWREQLAAAVGTSAERVAVQCVHQHNAPLTDLDTQAMIDQRPDLTPIMDVAWFHDCVERTSVAARTAVASARPVSAVSYGQAEVDQVAGNRRLLGPDGKCLPMRGSSSRNAELRALPEGLIDPFLKTIACWDGDDKLAALHYYATHPMSHYGDGQVSCDFCGLAREQRTREEGVPHLYFTGGGGNIGAGKYNDGSPGMRPILTGRIHRAMVGSETDAQRIAPDRLEWRTLDVELPVRGDVSDAELTAIADDPNEAESRRKGALMHLAYRHRVAAGKPILLTSLRLGGRICIVHLPGEPFVEYQLHATDVWPAGFVATAGYGDGGPGYLPLARSFAEEGYEPTWAFMGPEGEAVLKDAITELVRP